MLKNKKRNTSSGFTSVELLVTIMVAAIFILAFNQLFVFIQKTNAASRNHASASSIAYSHLRTYHASSRPDWFICSPASESSPSNPNPTGQILQDTTLNNTDLPNPVLLKVSAFAVKGCGTNKPIKVRSTVTYGTPAKEVTHATYTGL